MKSGDLLIRLAVPEDDPRILEVFSASFGRDRRYFTEFWKWFNYTCPEGRNRTAIIEDPARGRFAGSYSLIPIRLWINGQERKASLCTNVCIHPEYQRRGLFARVGAYALAQEPRFDTPISIGMPNAKALGGHLKVGWREMGSLAHLFKRDCEKRAHGCRQIDRFDGRFDALFDRIVSRFTFIVIKDQHWMNWRLVDRPDRRYTCMVLERGDDLAGYVVLKEFDDKDFRKTHIMDIQAEDDEAALELIAAAESFAAGRDELNLYTTERNPYQRLFEQRGFLVNEVFDRIIIHFNEVPEQLPEDGAWWFCFADNDVY